ncbi:MAG: rod shape-determining protein MreD [Armatimonadota bacterium]|nr:rod shape-determining protein MreD [Armatimonadota bacterium]MDR7422934.1 rod shape-determining protein MreD [Armatimonadota bacterium]MDR7454684.1 rod shape-determining protein MreD [Armatimonadota bacterium]MDR7456319.1 rod shape-determining protein MreD [Armatimonadota bacterium]MDR7496316.1 rod shape-determining protein MreD [Armatimonadota bacterium]
MLARTALLLGLLITGTVVDGAWLARLPLRASPDLSILVVLAAALRYGLLPGALLGAAAGYLRDLVGGSPLGLYMLSYLLVGAAAGAVAPAVDLQQRAVAPAAAFAGVAALALVTAGLVTLTGVAAVHWVRLTGEVLLTGALTAVLAGLADRAVRAVDHLTRRRYAGRVISHGVLR